jgi:hypothetical protein
MKTSLIVLASVLIALAALAPVPARQEPKPEPKPESLPEFPKVDPKNTITALNPEKTIFAELKGEEGKKKLIRVGLACEVCLREGPLEVFLCKKGTKEHESIVRIDADAKFIHLALKTAGAESGTPTQFIDPKTEEAKWKAATGSKVNVLVHYTRDGKTFTHAAQDWIWDIKKKAAIPHGWIFAGSIVIKDPDNGREYYGANSGDIISISNFPYSMLEIPVEISKDDAQLTYEVKTDKVPPLMSKVWVILEPAADKK